MRGQRGVGQRGGSRGVDAGRAMELRGAGRVAGGVVVDAALRLHFDGGQRARNALVLDDRDRDLHAVDELLRQHGVGVGEAAHHRGRQLRAVADDLRAERRAALVGLEHERQTEPVDHRVEHGLRAERPERGVRQRDPVGGVEARPRELGLGSRLVPRPAACARRGADERDPEQLQHRLHRTVLALSAVQRDRDRIGRIGRAGVRRARRRRPTRATSMPIPRRAAASRRPDRSDTSRSCEMPPASTATVRSARGQRPRSFITACAAMEPAALADGGPGRAAERAAARRAPPPAPRPAAGRPSVIRSGDG